MSQLGFLAFRTPRGAAESDFCLMVMLRDAPTRRHFDPETVGYWVIEGGHGQIRTAARGVATPISRPYSWGRIRLVDRFGARNSFVSFGGWVTGERVGRDALLLIFRSPAPILRLRGHSQRPDRLSDDVLAFFGRLLPPMWADPGHEHFVSSLTPEVLYAAFLLHEARQLETSAALRDAAEGDAGVLARELDRMARTHPEARAAGSCVLPLLETGRSAAR